MSESYTTVSSQGMGSRLIESIKGVAIGLVLFFGAIGLLFWNEGRTVAEMKSLAEGRDAVIPGVNPDTVGADKEGELVHMSGRAVTDDILKDPQFGIELNAIRLARAVEMYQWEQKTERKNRDKVGGGQETTTTYSYHPTWSSTLNDSSRFESPEARQRNRNPSAMPYTAESWHATNVTLGAFNLNDGQIRRISGARPLDDAALAVAVAAPVAGATDRRDGVTSQGGIDRPEGATDRREGATDPAGTERPRDGATGEAERRDGATASSGTDRAERATRRTAIPGGIYIGTGTAASPDIGDVKVTWQAVAPADITLVAQQRDSTFRPYRTRVGNEINMLQMGSFSADEMFDEAESAEAWKKWAFRFGGWLLMTIGLSLVFKPIVVIAHIIPFVGSIVGMGFGLAAAGIATVVSLFTIAIAWVVHRPLLGVILLVLAVGVLASLIALAAKMKGGAKDAPGPDAPPSPDAAPAA